MLLTVPLLLMQLLKHLAIKSPKRKKHGGFFLFIINNKRYGNYSCIYYTDNALMKKEGITVEDNKFTAEEERRIQEAVKQQEDKARQAEIDAEIRNRLLDAQRGKPGYNYY